MEFETAQPVSDTDQPASEIKNNSTDGSSKNKKKQKEVKRFRWWQAVLILVGTLIVSVGTAYYVSAKYFWSNTDKNRINQQVTYYEKRVDTHPNEPKERINLGYSYFLQGNNDDAIKQFKVALDLDKNNFDAYLNLSIVYDDEGDLNNALVSAQKAVKISPKDYKGQLEKGIILRKLKQYDDALNALNESNTLQPGNTDTIYQIGKVAEAQGHKKDAEKIYKEALGYDPLYKPALEALNQLTGKTK